MVYLKNVRNIYIYIYIYIKCFICINYITLPVLLAVTFMQWSYHNQWKTALWIWECLVRIFLTNSGISVQPHLTFWQISLPIKSCVWAILLKLLINTIVWILVVSSSLTLLQYVLNNKMTNVRRRYNASS